MSKISQKRTTSKKTGTLRQRSDSMAGATCGEVGRMDSKDIQSLVHDLRLRQIEMELRNEEMTNALAKLLGSEDELQQFNKQLDVSVKQRSGELLQSQGDLLEHVTHRRRVEEQLRSDIHATNALLDTAHVIILELDCNAKIVHFNRFMAEFSGYELKDIVGRDWFETFLPSEVHATIRELFRRAIAGEPVCGNVNPIIIKDGQRRQIEWFDKKLTDAQGKTIGLLCTGQDVTERLQHEKELALFAAIVRSTDDAIIATSLDAVIQSWNDGAHRIYGYSRDEAVGRHINLITPPDRRGEVEIFLHLLRNGQSVEHFETIRQSKQGQLINVSLTVSPLRDAAGVIVGASTIARDITARKHMEAQLRETERHLTEARIEEQRFFAQELHDGLGGQMFGINMLATALGKDLARQNRPETERVADLVQYIRDAYDQLRRLSHRLQPVDVGPGGLRAALSQLAQRTSAASPVDCRFNCPDPVDVQSPAHATHLYRIAQEAVNNALRHAKPKRIIIELNANGPLTTLSVCDDGTGIKKPSNGQEGMGLRTMNYRATQIGGGLNINPAPGGGTVVTCIYPNDATRD